MEDERANQSSEEEEQHCEKERPKITSIKKLNISMKDLENQTIERRCF